MRLTLRTMLAYLDNVLDPADTEALGIKINESDFASGLVQRVKGVMRKLRMDAPKLDGKGMGNDANTVSEYLDSSLPQDRVSDFERVCLESDKHLCEVAACHQILTLVLGKPADVSPELRDKIYALADPTGNAGSKAAGHAAATTLADAKTVVPPPVRGVNGQPGALTPEVPEYLRSGRRSAVWPILALAAAAVVMGLITLGLFSRFGGMQSLAALMRRTPQVAMNDKTGGETIEPTIETPPSRTSESPAAVDSAANDVAPPTATTPGDATAKAPEVAPSDVSPPNVATTEPPGAVPPGPAATTPDVPPPLPIEAPGPAVAVAPVPPAANSGKAPAPPAAQPAVKNPMDVGRYISDNQILGTLDSQDGLWYAKQPLAVLSAGERLIALPPYRPQIALPSSVQVTFAGEGSVLMEEPSENGVPRMTVEYGRLLVVTGGAAGAQLELDLAGVQGVATLVDADSAMAVKVSQWLPPGIDPEVAGGMPVVEIFNTHGRVTWRETGSEKVEIPTHFVRIYVGVDSPSNEGPYVTPDWIDARSTDVRPIALVDRETALKLERLLDPDKPLNLWLQEMTQDKRVDIRTLTARCLSYLNEFEPLIRELSDSRQSAYWFPEVEALRHALARGPETAASVREALARVRSTDAKELYRLLWGFSQEQLDRGDDSKLVRLLEHDQLDMRVLAFANLVNITGAQEFYRPERSPQLPQTRTSIQNWKERRDKRSIAYRYPPSPVENYKPLAPPAAEVRPGSPGVPPRDR